jgi:hypothetical protein
MALEGKDRKVKPKPPKPPKPPELPTSVRPRDIEFILWFDETPRESVGSTQSD